MNYRISHWAKIDLEHIWFYTFENWSVNKADIYVSNIFMTIKRISKNPQLGKDYSHIKKDYLRIRSQKHFIFYKINRSDDCLDIIRILHERMDLNERIA
jgi:toxin ParE1/3/4